jgi:hypothetical protein
MTGDPWLVTSQTTRFFDSRGAFVADLSEVGGLRRAQTEVCATKLPKGAPHPGCFL